MHLSGVVNPRLVSSNRRPGVSRSRYQRGFDEKKQKPAACVCMYVYVHVWVLSAVSLFSPLFVVITHRYFANGYLCPFIETTRLSPSRICITAIATNETVFFFFFFSQIVFVQQLCAYTFSFFLPCYVNFKRRSIVIRLRNNFVL